jgi:hypothetical protein
MGTILDDYTAASDSIRASGNAAMLFAFIIFTLISSFMMLNMLIGVLVEVVDATKEGERNKAIETKVRDVIGKLFDSMDEDSNREISRGEFMGMRKNKEVMEALKELDIGGMHFEMYSELFFSPPAESMPAPTMGYEALVSMILRLRPGSFVSALDFASFARAISCIHDRIKERIVTVENLCLEIAEDTLGGTDTNGDGIMLMSKESSDGGRYVVVGASENTSENQGPRGLTGNVPIPGAIPDPPPLIPGAIPDPPPLVGWEQALDPESGKYYYCNRATGESRWTPPVANPTALPPPPPPSSGGTSLDRPVALQDCVGVVEGPRKILDRPVALQDSLGIAEGKYFGQTGCLARLRYCC